MASFRGRLWFCSNFYPLEEPIYLENDTLPYSTAEHAYQAAKSLDQTYRRKVQAAKTPGIAKRLGKKILVRSDWPSVKLDVMRYILQQKFKKGSVLAAKLLATKDEELVEVNEWYDFFWGQCPKGSGLNWLGRLLMEIRSNLKIS